MDWEDFKKLETNEVGGGSGGGKALTAAQFAAKHGGGAEAIDTSEIGAVSNTARLAGGRALDLVGEGIGAAGDLMTAATDPFYKGLIGLDDNPVKNIYQTVEDTLVDFDLGGEYRNTWEKVKTTFNSADAPTKDKIAATLAYIGETGTVSLVDAAAAVAALPAYIVARSGELGGERAANNAIENQLLGSGNEQDLANTVVAAPFAVGTALLERIGGKAIAGMSREAIEQAGKKGVKEFVKRVSKEAGKVGFKEAATEFLQEGGIEYLAETLGTEQRWEKEQALDRGLAGAVAGGGIGAGAGGTREALQAIAAPGTVIEEAPPNSETIAEPAQDIAAQARQMLHGDTKKDSVFLAEPTRQNTKQVEEELNKLVAEEDAVLYRHEDGGNVMYTTNPEKLAMVQEGGFESAPLMAEVLGYTQSKMDVDANAQSSVVAKRDILTGDIYQSEVVDQDRQWEAYRSQQKDIIQGQQVVILTPNEAAADRSARVANYDKSPLSIEPTAQRSEVALKAAQKEVEKNAKADAKEKAGVSVDETKSPVESPTQESPTPTGADTPVPPLSDPSPDGDAQAATDTTENASGDVADTQGVQNPDGEISAAVRTKTEAANGVAPSISAIQREHRIGYKRAKKIRDAVSKEAADAGTPVKAETPTTTATISEGDVYKALTSTLDKVAERIGMSKAQSRKIKSANSTAGQQVRGQERQASQRTVSIDDAINNLAQWHAEVTATPSRKAIYNPEMQAATRAIINSPQSVDRLMAIVALEKLASKKTNTFTNALSMAQADVERQLLAGETRTNNPVEALVQFLDIVRRQDNNPGRTTSGYRKMAERKADYDQVRTELANIVKQYEKVGLTEAQAVDLRDELAKNFPYSVSKREVKKDGVRIAAESRTKNEMYDDKREYAAKLVARLDAQIKENRLEVAPESVVVNEPEQTVPDEAVQAAEELESEVFTKVEEQIEAEAETAPNATPAKYQFEEFPVMQMLQSTLSQDKYNDVVDKFMEGGQSGGTGTARAALNDIIKMLGTDTPRNQLREVAKAYAANREYLQDIASREHGETEFDEGEVYGDGRTMGLEYKNEGGITVEKIKYLAEKGVPRVKEVAQQYLDGMAIITKANKAKRADLVDQYGKNSEDYRAASKELTESRAETEAMLRSILEDELNAYGAQSKLDSLSESLKISDLSKSYANSVLTEEMFYPDQAAKVANVMENILFSLEFVPEDGAGILEDIAKAMSDAGLEGHPFVMAAKALAPEMRVLDIPVSTSARMAATVDGRYVRTLKVDGGAVDKGSIELNHATFEESIYAFKKYGDFTGLSRMMHTIIHEAAHAVTVNGYVEAQANNDQLATLINMVYGDVVVATTEELRAVESQENINELYGTYDPMEMLAEAISNPVFAQRLREITPGETTQKLAQTVLGESQPSLFDTLRLAVHKFMDFIAKFTGLPAPTQEQSNALDIILYATPILSERTKNINGTQKTAAENKKLAEASWDLSAYGNTLSRYIKKEISDRAVLAAAGTNEMRRPSQAELQKQGRKAMATVDEFMGERAADNRRGISNVAKGMGLRVRTLDQIVRTFKSSFRKVKNGQVVSFMDKYVGVVRHRVNIVNNLRKSVDEVVSVWAPFAQSNPEDTKTMHRIMQDSTITKVDPTELWDSEANQGATRTDAEKAKWRELRTELYNLPPTAVTIFNRAKAHYAKVLTDTRRYSMGHFVKQHAEALGMVDDYGLPNSPKVDKFVESLDEAPDKAAFIMRTMAAQGADPEVTQSVTASLMSSFSEMQSITQVKGVYFPLVRYGDYVVSVVRPRDTVRLATEGEAKLLAAQINSQTHPDYGPESKAKVVDGFRVEVVDERVEFLKGEGEAITRREELVEEFGEQFVKPVRTTHINPGGTAPNYASQLVTQAIENMPEGETGDTARAAIQKAFFQLSAEHTANKSRISRRDGGVAGADQDMLRIFAERGSQSAWTLADLRTSYDQSKVMQNLRELADIRGTQAGRVVNELVRRDRSDFDGRDVTTAKAVETALTKTGFYWFLGSPSYSIVNATQVPLLTLPYLGARYGYHEATRALGSNWVDTARQVGKEAKASGGGWSRLPDKLFDNIQDALEGNGKVGEAAMLKSLFDRQIIDATFIQEVFQAAAGPTRGLKSDKAGVRAIGNATEGITNMARGWPQMVEQLNRVSTALAAYELSQKFDGNADHVEAAAEAVLQTQFDYSDLNRPGLFKDMPFGRAFLLFKMYSQGMTALLLRSFDQGYIIPIRKRMGSKDPYVASIAAKDMAAAKKQFRGILVSHTLASGILGGVSIYPVRMMAEAAASWWGDDEDWDYDRAVTKYVGDLMADNFEEDTAKTLTQLVTRGPLGSRTSLNSLWFMSRDNYSDTNEEAYQNWMMTVLGPLGSMGHNAMRGMDYIERGEVQKGLEALAPKGVRDFLKAERLASDGLTDYSGAMYADGFDGSDAFWTAVGFRTLAEGQASDSRRMQQKFERNITNRRDKLMVQYNNLGSADEKKEFFEKEIAPFNEQYRSARISRGDLLRKQNRRRDKERDYERGRTNKYRETKDAFTF